MTRDQIVEEIQFGATRAELARSLGVSVQKLRGILNALDIKWSKVKKIKTTKRRAENARLQLVEARFQAMKSRQIHTAFGVTDTLRGLHSRFGVTSFVGFEKRRARGMSLEEALTKPSIRGESNEAKN